MRTLGLREHKAILADFIVLLTVPGVLGLVHFFIPDALFDQLLFTYGNPDLLTVWTAALLHDSNMHLGGNVAVYVLATAFAYILYAVDLQERRRFWITVAVLLVFVPPITRAIDYVVLYQYAGILADGAASKGFSAVASAFGGMLLTAIGLFVADEYDSYLAVLTTLLIVTASVAVIAAVNGVLTPSLAGLLVLDAILFVVGFAYHTDLRELDQLREAVEQNAVIIIQIACFGAIVGVILFLMIPVEAVQDDTFTNVLSHLTGFVIGLTVAALIPSVPINWL